MLIRLLVHIVSRHYILLNRGYIFFVYTDSEPALLTRNIERLYEPSDIIVSVADACKIAVTQKIIHPVCIYLRAYELRYQRHNVFFTIRRIIGTPFKNSRELFYEWLGEVLGKGSVNLRIRVPHYFYGPVLMISKSEYLFKGVRKRPVSDVVKKCAAKSKISLLICNFNSI